MKTKRKSLGILLSLVLVISMLPTIPMTAFAAATVEVGTSWADLQTAITSAGTTETTIKLTADLTADATTDSALLISENQKITLDLNGHMLDRNLVAENGSTSVNEHGSVIEVTGGALTVIDSSPTTSHAGFISNSAAKKWHPGVDETKESLTVYGGIITGGSGKYYSDGYGGAGISVESTTDGDASLTMTKGTIIGNVLSTGKSGAGIYIISGTLALNGTSIIHNYNYANGTFSAGVCVKADVTAEIKNCDISDNYGSGYGSAIYNAGTLDIYDTTITNNYDRMYGVISNAGILNFHSGSVTNNTAGSGPAAISNSKTLNLIADSGKEISITGNSCAKMCGGIKNTSTNSSLTISGAVIIKDNITTGTTTYTDAALGGTVSYPVDLATSKPIIIAGDLTGSDINASFTDSNAKHTAGVLTSGFQDGLDDYIHYQGPARLFQSLNDDGEITLTFSHIITISDAEHGTVEAVGDLTRAEGDTVSFTVTPDSGWQLKSLKYYTTDPESKTDITDELALTMPTADVTVVPEFEPLQSTVSIASASHGTVSAAVSGTPVTTTAGAGSEVTITTTPDTGYQLKSLKWYKTASGESSATDITSTKTFTMPTEAVTIVTEFEPICSTITVTPSEHGTVEPKAGEVLITTPVPYSSEITLVVTPDAHYKLKSLKWYKTASGVGTATDITSTKSFTMPEENVTVVAEFEIITSEISIASATNGSITAKVGGVSVSAPVDANSTVTLEDTPVTGYQLKSLKWYKTASGASTATDITSSKTFTMPDEAVTVAAEFEPISYTITVVPSANGSIELKSGGVVVTESVPYTSEVTITAAPEADYKLKSLKWYKTASGEGSATDITSTKTFTMPAEAVTVVTEFELVDSEITILSATNGSITAKVGGANVSAPVTARSTVTLEDTPDSGYKLKSLKWYKTASGASTATDITLAKEFTMPGEAVTIAAEFEEIVFSPVSVTTDTYGGAKFFINGEEVTGPIENGTEVTLVFTPEEGYELESYTLTDVDGNPIPVVDNKFIMPSKGVVLGVVFKAIPTGDDESDDEGGSTTGSNTGIIAPKTGDYNNVLPLFIFLMMGILGFAATLICTKKQK